MKLLISAITVAATGFLVAPSLAGEWTGTYLGAQIGQTDVASSGGLTGGSETTYGVHGGYDIDFGEWVLGGELEWDRVSLNFAGGTATMDDIGRLKFKAGYDFGPGMGYVVLGGAQASTTLGNDSAAVYGLGLAVLVNYSVSLSAEYLRHDFTDIGGTTTDAETDVFNLRASFRF